MSHSSMICPLCGSSVSVAGPCEKCVPRLTVEEVKTFEVLQKLPEDDLLAMLGLAVIKEEILKLLEAQPEHLMSAESVAISICRQMPDIHTGTVRRTIRLMVDDGQVQLEPGNILKLN